MSRIKVERPKRKPDVVVKSDEEFCYDYVEIWLDEMVDCMVTMNHSTVFKRAWCNIRLANNGDIEYSSIVDTWLKYNDTPFCAGKELVADFIAEKYLLGECT